MLKRVRQQRGQVPSGAMHRLPELGFTDESLVEIVARSALHLLTTCVNDTPSVPATFPQMNLSRAT